MLRSLREKIKHCQTKDLYRFSKIIKSLQKTKLTGSKQKKQISELSELINASVSTSKSNRKLIPKSIHFPETLPVSLRAKEIRDSLRENQVLIVAGDTGSGKTTQLPKICLDAGYGVRGLIGHCQPRRLAATSVAARVADELNTKLGELVGYQVRFNDRFSETCRVKLMTDGILLAEIQSDPYLSKYEVVIVDEAHERSLNIDFILGYLKRLISKRDELKIIITSATIDVDKFSNHFNRAEVISVKGRMFPVETRYLPMNLASEEKEKTISEKVCDSVISLAREASKGISDAKDILVFLSSEREIREASRVLRKKKHKNLEILPLYARLPQSEQSRIFKEHTTLRVILSTNVAETSITVPKIKYVIDTGLARISRYSFQSKIQRLPIEKISQASANQRKGRCGRIEDGVCIRLYAEEDFNTRVRYTDPEIIRTNLAAVILRMLSLNLGDIFKFPFLDKPESKSINEGFKLLAELKAVNEFRKLTKDGRRMALISVDPKHAKMLLVANSKNCLKELLIIVSLLSIQDPRESGHVELNEADYESDLYNSKNSDFLALINLWIIFEETRKLGNSSRLKKFCRQYRLSYTRMREWKEVYFQLTLTCRRIGLRINKKPSNYADIHKSIIAGSLNQLAYRSTERQYIGSRNKKFIILNSSVLARALPKWVVTGELIETTQTFAAMAAKIDPVWIEEIGEHLVKREVHSPHWSVRTQSVKAFERVRLYGLTIIEKTRVEYSSVNQEHAHEIFLSEGLSKSAVKTDAAFYKQNQQILEAIRAEENKLRRPEKFISENDINAFYSKAIPENITSTKELENWIRDPESGASKKLILDRMALFDNNENPSTNEFPDSISLSSNQIPINYTFQPGAKKDGATVQIPLQLINQLSDADIDWAVPGIIREKCIALLKGLPKATRKKLIPISGFVDDIISEMFELRGDLFKLLATLLIKQRRINIAPVQFANISLPDHLIIKINVVDKNRKSLAIGSNVNEVKRLLSKKGIDFQRSEIELPEEWNVYDVENLTDWDFEILPKTIDLKTDLKIVRYPGLVDSKNSVSLKLFSEFEQALECTKHGLIRLYLLRSVQQKNMIKKKYYRFKIESALKIPLDFTNFVEDAIYLTYLNAFDVHTTIPRSKNEFDEQLSIGKSKLYSQSEELLLILDELFEERISILRKLSSVTDKNLTYFCDDIHLQLDNLLVGELFFKTTIDRLRQFPRYLKGIKLRLERAPHLGANDYVFTQEISEFWAEYKRLDEAISADDQNKLDDIRWMIEEYRISLFAQSLGTKISVSSKKIRNAIDRLTA